MMTRRRAVVLLSAASALVAGLLTMSQAQAAVTPDGWYTVTAANSGKCVDARAAGTANGTVVQQYSCNQTASQEWQFQSTGDGYFRVNARTNPAATWDVTNVSTADGGLVQLWTYGGGANQQGRPSTRATAATTSSAATAGSASTSPGRPSPTPCSCSSTPATAPPRSPSP
jgi:hypothetical protein